MYISAETPEESEKRLLKVMASAELTILEGTYAFEEFNASDFVRKARPDALAFIKDGDQYSQLVPTKVNANERYAIFSFHFQAGLDNSGFVGWLATRLKRTTGTGVFVLCGHNSARGGIFDYWGCPHRIGDNVIRELRALLERARAAQ